MLRGGGEGSQCCDEADGYGGDPPTLLDALEHGDPFVGHGYPPSHRGARIPDVVAQHCQTEDLTCRLSRSREPYVAPSHKSYERMFDAHAFTCVNDNKIFCYSKSGAPSRVFLPNGQHLINYEVAITGITLSRHRGRPVPCHPTAHFREGGKTW